LAHEEQDSIRVGDRSCARTDDLEGGHEEALLAFVDICLVLLVWYREQLLTSKLYGDQLCVSNFRDVAELAWSRGIDAH